MFTQLSDRLTATFRNLRGKGRLSEDNVTAALREVRVALLEADVSLDVVREFIDGVKARAVGGEVLRSVSPAQAVIAVVRDELVELMGAACDELNLAAEPPAVVLVAGQQGAGKTTTVGKLAHLLGERRKKVMTVAADLQRPAAVEQLRRLSDEVGAQFFHRDDVDAVQLARDGVTQARKMAMDVVLIDTAGRLHVDAQMMDEIRQIRDATAPVETLFVVDSMSGQDAVNSARAFNDAVAFTGVVLTKTDGDARGGAALSIRHVTGKPIKFIGVGERLDALEPFHPQRIAARILGMGDVLSLVEDAQRQADDQQAKQLADKVARGKGFTLADFREQLAQMQKMGGLKAIAEKLPSRAAQTASQIDEKQFTRNIAIIDSMTPGERRRPDILRATRKKRVAAGAGVQVQEVNRLLKQFTQTQKMLKRAGKGGMKRMMAQLQGGLG